MAQEKAQREAEETARQEELTREKALDEQIASLYQQSLVSYRNKNYPQAQGLFSKILVLDASQEKAKTYLENKIPDKLKKLQAARKRKQELAQKEAQREAEKAARQQELAQKKAQREARVKDRKKEITIKKAARKEELVQKKARRAADKDQHEQELIQKKVQHEQELANKRAQREQELAQKKAQREADKAARQQELAQKKARRAADKDQQEQELAQQKAQREAKKAAREQELANKRAQREQELAQKKAQREAEKAAREQEIAQKKAQQEQEIANKKAQREAKKAAREQEIARKKALKEQIESLYQRAIRSYTSKDYSQAQDLFNQILALDANQNKARTYLEVKIASKLKKLEAIRKHKQKLAQRKAQREQELAQQKAQREAEKATHREQRAKRKGASRQERAEQKALKNKLDSFYEQAITFYNHQYYRQAQGMFSQILALDANQSKAKFYLEVKIPNTLKELEATRKREQELAEEKALEGQIASLYQQALAAYNGKDYSQAQDLFNQILALDANQSKAKTYLEVKIPERSKRVKDDSNVELESYMVAAEHEAYGKLQELKAKQAEKSRKELINRVSSKIDKLFDLAKEAERRQDYQQAEEFYKEVLSLIKEKKIRGIVNKRKSLWMEDIADERNERVWVENQLKAASQDPESNFTSRGWKAESSRELLKEKMAGKIRQREEAEKKEAALKAAAEKKELVEVAVVEPKETAAEPVGQFYTRDLETTLSEAQELLAQGNEMLEEKKFKQAYKFFKAVVEVCK